MRRFGVFNNKLNPTPLTKPIDFGLPDGVLSSEKKGQSPFDWINRLSENLSIKLDVDNLHMNNGVALKGVSGVVVRQDNLFEKLS